MCDLIVRLGVVIALVALAVGGCAPSSVTSPPPASAAADRPSDAQTPSNFASPEDMLKRYPTMRRQQL